MPKVIAIALKDMKFAVSGKTELLFFLILPLDIYLCSYRECIFGGGQTRL